MGSGKGWLNSIRTKSVKTGGAVEIRGISGGVEMARLSDFHKDITDDEEYYSDFLRIDPPAGRRKGFDDGRTPEYGWEFTFAMDLKPVDPKKKK